MCNLIILLYCADLPLALAWQGLYRLKYRQNWNAKQVPERLLRLMRSYYEDASQRIAEQNHKRFMYEESPHYETGYLMHEVIERYKKMVEQMHRMVDFKAITVYENIERTEQIQKLYFEIFHLVNMIHEIPRKWKDAGEFGDRGASKMNDSDYLMSKAELKGIEERRKKELKAHKKLLKKRREMIMKGLAVFTERPKPGSKKNPYNRHWPLDYGWEIDWW